MEASTTKTQQQKGAAYFIVSLSNHNYKRYHILNLINHYGRVSRTDLANITDYCPSTISQIVKELLDEQVILETGSVNVGQGRRRTLLELNISRLCIISVVIYPPSVDVAFCTCQGTVLEQVSTPFDGNFSADEIVNLVIQNVNELKTHFPEKEIIGVGICDPGVV